MFLLNKTAGGRSFNSGRYCASVIMTPNVANLIVSVATVRCGERVWRVRHAAFALRNRDECVWSRNHGIPTLLT